MSNYPVPIPLQALHKAIENGIRTAMPEFHAVYSDYRRFSNVESLPICLIEFSQVERAQDPGTSQTHVNCRFEARIVASQIDIPAGRLLARELALKLCNVIDRNIWENRNKGILFSGLVGAFPDGFDPDLDNHEVWRVEWEQGVIIGEPQDDYIDTAWTGEELPTTVNACSGETIHANG